MSLLGSPPRWFLCRTAALDGPYARRVITVGGWVAARGDLDILQAYPRVGLRQIQSVYTVAASEVHSLE